jgi:hypothetical protein
LRAHEIPNSLIAALRGLVVGRCCRRDRKRRHDDLADPDPAGDASPCYCASLKWRHRPFAQIGAQRVGNCLSILPLILVEETTCNEPPDLVLLQRYRDALSTGFVPPAVTSHAFACKRAPGSDISQGNRSNEPLGAMPISLNAMAASSRLDWCQAGQHSAWSHT